MTREILCESLKQNLCTLSLEEFAHLFVNETVAIEEFYKLCKGVSAGKTISLLFNPHRLSTDNEKDDLSVYESLQDANKVSGLARLYLYNLEHDVNNAFYASIQRGYNNIQYINEFPPYVARQIYLRYAKHNDVRVFDPCCGWGGRMIGCASIPNTTYIGCEPSTKTYEGLLKLGKWLKILQPTFNYEIYKMPFEDFEYLGDRFDIALTSPPYYNTEHYSDEETNSLNRYKTFDSWVTGFYTPLIEKTLSMLISDGVFILNIGDRKYPLSDEMFKICNSLHINVNRINDYLSGNGENKEKFYTLSYSKKYNQLITRSLF